MAHLYHAFCRELPLVHLLCNIILHLLEPTEVEDCFTEDMPDFTDDQNCLKFAGSLLENYVTFNSAFNWQNFYFYMCKNM